DGVHEVHVRWMRADGVTQRSVPAEVRREHAKELKELQRTAEDIRKMLPVQRDRIERLLAGVRTWTLRDWRQRYLDHPLLAPLARRLIWSFKEGERFGLGAWRDGAILDVENRHLDWLTDDTGVRLWHP